MRRRPYIGLSPLLLALLWAAPALAQSALATYTKISAGTGFVINREGIIVTNAHVVRGCESIRVRTEAGDTTATLLATDARQDLALLDIPDHLAKANAPMRWNISDLRTGDPVIVMGYPGESGIHGRYHFKKTTVSALTGPSGEGQWIQLESVAERGNSGGPVLDTTGNVIAVISGVAITYRVDPKGAITPEQVGQSDVAITLAALQDFLRENGVSFYESASGLVAYADGVIESNAHQFIVPVQCVQGTITR